MSLVPHGRKIPILSYPPVKYVWRDQFITPRLAGAINGTACEPGPGNRVAADTGNNLTIANDKLNVAPGVGVGDPGYWGPALARTVGRTLFAKWNISNGANKYAYIAGFDNNQATGLAQGAIYLNSTNLIAYANTTAGGDTTGTLDTYADGTDYVSAIMLRSAATAGSLFLIKGGAFAAWKLMWVAPTGNGATVYPASIGSSTGAVFAVEDMGVIDLPAPWNADFGIATQQLAGARSASDTFIHEGDCLIEYIVTTLPNPATTITLDFRRQDATNYWQVVIASDGSLVLNEVVGGGATSRGTGAAASIANGQRMVIRCYGQTIRVYANNVLKITYALATNFATATAGVLSSLGTGGAVSSIVSWPYTISGAALQVLNRQARNFL